MPHDINGQLVNVGDIVHIPCRVKAVHMTEEYCNLDLQLIYPMPPYTDPPSYSAINTKQVIKQEKK